MSLILPSSSAPRPSGHAAAPASARHDAAPENAAGSFGEALSRSLEPATQVSRKGGDKATAARRPADKPKSGAEEVLNALALAFVPLQTRSAPAAPGEALAPAKATTAAPALTAAVAATATAGTAPAARAPAQTLFDAGMAASTVLPALKPVVMANEPVTADLSTDTARQAALAAALEPASPSIVAPATGLTPLQKVQPAAADPTAIVLAPGVIAKQSAAAESDFLDQSAQRDDQPAIDLAGLRKSATEPRAVDAGPVIQTAADLASPDTGAAMLGQAQATVASARPAEFSATPSLAPGVGSPEWGKALGQQVIHLSQTGPQVAELQLNPPGLGPLKVTLSMNDQQMQATFVSAHASVRVAIEAALPQLRSTLADSGISLGDTSVSSGNQQQTAFNERPGEQPSPRSDRNQRAPDLPAVAARHADEPTRLHRVGRVGNAGGVDTYA